MPLSLVKFCILATLLYVVPGSMQVYITLVEDTTLIITSKMLKSTAW